MTKMSSTMFSVGTLLRAAEDNGTEVRVLVEGNWIAGRVLGCDGHGAVLDGGESGQFLVRLEAVSAVSFVRADIDQDVTGTGTGSRSHGGTERGPIEAGPITVPSQASGASHFLSAAPY